MLCNSLILKQQIFFEYIVQQPATFFKLYRLYIHFKQMCLTLKASARIGTSVAPIFCSILNFFLFFLLVLTLSSIIVAEAIKNRESMSFDLGFYELITDLDDFP